MRILAHFVGPVLLAVAVGLLSPVAAQDTTQNVRAQPGYVDFGSVESWFDADATVEINLKGSLLNLVASASEHSDPEFSQLVRSLSAIQVRGFPTQGVSSQVLEDRARRLTSMLEDQGWERALYVQEAGETSHIYVRRTGEDIAGLTLLSTNPDSESVFVNIVGSIRPEQIHKLGRELEIERLENVETSRQQ